MLHFMSFLLCLFAASCSPVKEKANYPLKGDVKPHPGVARAHSYPIHGIDISKWQGEVDWNEVREAGTAFVYIKATEGMDHVDERFLINWQGAKAAGVPRGAYHFMFWCSSAEDQAAWFKKNIPADPDALPPVLDIEWNAHSKLCPNRIPPEEALKKIYFMLREMEKHTGKKPIIYTDITFHETVLQGINMENLFWLRSVAAPPEERYVNRKLAIWQFTTTGRVPGIKGAVDRNAFVGSRSDWQQFLAFNGIKPQK